MAALADKSSARALMSRAGLPLSAGQRRAGADRRRGGRGRRRRRLPGDRQGRRRGRRPGHDRGHDPGRAAPRRTRGPGPPRRPPSATTGCTSSVTSPRRGTSRCRCSATPTATACTWAPGTARCSAGTRSWSRRRPRRRCPPPSSTPSPRPPCGARSRSASSAPARSSSWSTPRSGSTSWRSTAGSRWSTRSPRWSPASTWCTSNCTSPPGCRCGWRQEEIRLHGVAVECRVNAEDPDRGLRAHPRPAGPVHPTRRPVHPGGHPRQRRLPGRPRVRLAARQGGRLGAGPGAGAQPAGTGPGRVRHRRAGRAHHHPVRPAGARRRRIPQGPLHHRPGRPSARRARAAPARTTATPAPRTAPAAEPDATHRRTR